MPSDEETLRGWSFFRDYERHRNELIDLARFTYSFFTAQGVTPSKDDCKAVYRQGLSGSRLFGEMARHHRFLPRHTYQAFAFLLADYVIDKHWTEVESQHP